MTSETPNDDRAYIEERGLGGHMERYFISDEQYDKWLNLPGNPAKERRKRYDHDK